MSEPPAPEGPRRERLGRLVGTGAVVLALAMAALAGFVEDISADFHWHVVLGREVLESGAPYTRDLHSHTFGGQPVFVSSWFADVLFAIAYELGGLPGSYLLRTLALAGLVLLLVFELRARGVRTATAAALVMVVLADRFYFFYVRPETLAFALLAGLLLALGAHQRSGKLRHLAAVLAIVLLWANLHGSVSIGLFVLGAYAVEQVAASMLAAQAGGALDRRKLWTGLALPPLAFGAACLNPEGHLLTLAVFDVVSPLWVETINEWRPPGSDELIGFRAILVAVGATTLLALVVARRTSPWHVLAAAVLGYLAWQHRRFGTYAEIVSLPLLAVNLSLLRAELERVGRARRWRPAGAVLVSLAVAWSVGTLVLERDLREVGTGLNEDTAYYPELACDVLRREGRPGPIFNSYDFASYLMFCLGRDFPLFIDQRAWSLYSDEFYARYREAARSEAAMDRLLAEHPVAWAVVGYDPFARYFAARPESWRLVHFDDGAFVYANLADERTAELAARGLELLEPYRLLALVDLPPELHDRAREELRRQKARCPRCTRTVLAESALALATGDADGFERTVGLLGPAAPVERAFLSGRLALGQGRSGDALESFSQFRRLGGDATVGAVFQARALAQDGRYDDALTTLELAEGAGAPARAIEVARREVEAVRASRVLESGSGGPERPPDGA